MASNIYKFELNEIFKDCDPNDELDKLYYLERLTLSLYGCRLKHIKFIDGNKYNLCKNNIKIIKK